MGTTEFELEGRKFAVQSLEPDDSCKGLEVLGKALGPAALLAFAGSVSASGEDGQDGAAAEEKNLDYGALLQAMVSQASQIGVLLKLFAPRTRFDRGGNGNMVALKEFVSEVFGGRIDLTIAFLVHAVRAEYSCFLGGSNALGPLVAQLVGQQQAANASKSPTAPTP
jgi:hypothetical protein